MSTDMQRCVCASKRPGITVERERSMTAAPAGMLRPAPTALTFPPSTRMIWLAAAVPVSGSTSRPARIAVTCAAASTHAKASARMMSVKSLCNVVASESKQS
jgi:hypothetical protein